MMPKILIVDDEEHVISALKRSLMDEQYEAVGAGSAMEALELMAVTQFKVVISDERMPGMDGAEFLGIVKERFPETVRMMLTGHASVEATMRAVNSGEIYRFFTKPWDDSMLILAIRSAIEKFDLEAENRRLLRTVKRQSQELRQLETKYPGISEMKRTAQGAYELPEIDDDEIARIINEYSKS
jgi:DNA-binding NtrC family response regulator